ncbi:peptide ABC transporter substrate-binding protein [Sulfobacillus thermosulfidooxidans]|uniref:peptide ABC transporter substrate-binding protein n=1 Tax=Sulfobacillus thermosulfidooxidans TaxID=28034 RepID=UPI0006B481FB|nr:peptide ABC transporter substrate-binding protein [Sulfobacillus thermosulfidooxidans]
MKRNTSKKITLASALAVTASLALAGCGSTPTTTSQPSSASLKPQSGGTIVMALPADSNVTWYFPLMDGPSDSVYNAWVQSLMYKSLFTIGPTGSIDYSRSIAESIKPNAAGTQYVVTMNPKYHWSNGHPVTAQDVVFTWDLIKAASASNAPAPWPYVGAGTGDIPSGVKSVVANGPYQFTVTLNQPANQEWFIYNGLGQFTPLPKSVFDKYPTNMTQELNYLAKVATEPTSSVYQVVDGPFKLSQAVSSQKWVFVPNPSYDGHKAYVSKLIFQYETSGDAEFAALKTGQIQVGYLPNSLWGSRAALYNNYNLSVQNSLAYGDVLVNMNHGNSQASLNAPNGVGDIFKNLYVRQAMQMGINQQAINDAAFHGNAVDEVGIIPPKPKTIFFDPSLKTIYPYNPAQGKKLLEEHGWHEVNGVMTKNGQQMKFQMVYSSGSQSFVQEATLLQQGWAKEGIDVSLKAEPFSTIIGLTNNQWDIMDYGGIAWGGSYPTGGGLFGKPGQGLDNQGYYNPEMVKLIALTHKPYPTQQQSLQALYNFQAFVAKDLPVLFVPWPPSYTEVAKNVHNVVKYANPFTGGISPNYWWVSK